jgi:hypothetical protein
MEPQDERVHGVTPGLSRDYATRTSNRQASFVEHEIGQLEALAASSGLFTYYQKEICRTLSLIGHDGHAEKAKTALKDFPAGLSITPEDIKISHSSPVNRRAPSSTLLVAAPPPGGA